MPTEAFNYRTTGQIPLPPPEIDDDSVVPFGDPLWSRGFVSPYFNTKEHAAFRDKCRAFVETHVNPNIDEWEKTGYPKTLFKLMAENGLFGSMFPSALGGTPTKQHDVFYNYIWADELARCGSMGIWLSTEIVTMALPPVVMDGPEEMREHICPLVLKGDKHIALAITEGWAGSDVAGMKCTAVRCDSNSNPGTLKVTSKIFPRLSGAYYRISGQKKWITCGMYADYFTLACRTGGPGGKGISLILVERERPGVQTEKMQLQGNWAGGTAIVTFEDVIVPVENLIGKENEGFKTIMKNFNHERFVIAVGAIRSARLCLEESIKRARRRKTFGKQLKESQVIRHKIAEMASQVECVQAFCDSVAFQMQSGTVDDTRVGALVSLLKVRASKLFKFCALEASQVFGGLSYTREGVGGIVERAVREMVGTAIPGGSEEILMDLGMKLSKL